MTSPVFYLGSHHPHWLWNGAVDVPLFVSHRTLGQRKTLHPAVVPSWALDSGGFSELQKNGRWLVSPREYVQSTARYAQEIGRLDWAAPQDFMCEEAIIEGGVWNGQKFAGTRAFLDPARRLSRDQMIDLHQRLTVENFQELEILWPQYSDLPCPYRPVLQGKPGNVTSYLRHAQMYEEAGVCLADYTPVGVGSVCRIQDSPAAGRLARGLAPLGLNLHWFGIKLGGLPKVWPHIYSHDSLAWSYGARRSPRMNGCTHVSVRGRNKGKPNNCANCVRAALHYYGRVILLTGSLLDSPWQDELFILDDSPMSTAPTQASPQHNVCILAVGRPSSEMFHQDELFPAKKGKEAA